MDARTPTLILLGTLLAALAFSVLGLAADNVAYVSKHHDSTLDLHYLRWNQTDNRPYAYNVQIDYLPSRFDMGRVYAMVAAGVISAIIGVGVAVASWKSRGDKAIQSQTSKRSVMFPVSLVLALVSFILSLSVVIYAWYPVMQWAINFRKSLPLPPSVTGTNKKTLQYQSPFALTPDTWNCWISSYTVDPAVGDRLNSLCREADVAKILMIPVFIISAALVAGVAFSWWKVNRAAASAPEEKKEVEEVSA